MARNTNESVMPDKEGIPVTIHTNQYVLDSDRVPIWEKYNLTVFEAADYFGIGVNKLRELTNQPNCKYVLRIGTKKLIKRAVFESYLDSVYVI